jgi:hypothetical protein
MPSQFQPAQVTGISPSNTWQNNYSRILQTGNVQVEGPRYAQIQRPPPPLKPSANKPTVNQLLMTQQTSSMTNRTGFHVFDTSFVLSKTLRSPETFIASVTKQWSKRFTKYMSWHFYFMSIEKMYPK